MWGCRSENDHTVCTAKIKEPGSRCSHAAATCDGPCALPQASVSIPQNELSWDTEGYLQMWTAGKYKHDEHTYNSCLKRAFSLFFFFLFFCECSSARLIFQISTFPSLTLKCVKSVIAKVPHLYNVCASVRVCVAQLHFIPYPITFDYSFK